VSLGVLNGQMDRLSLEKTLSIRFAFTVSKKMTSKKVKKHQKTSKIFLVFEATAAGLE
jgi:hypothetical protein